MTAVRDIDRGWDRIKRDLAAMKKASVKVGVQEDAPPAEGGTSMALVAAVNEFGSDDGHVPERSFLRSAVDAGRNRYLQDLAKLLRGVVAGRGSVHRALSIIGAGMQGDIQKRIVDVREPPNAESTIEAKGSSNPLIDTGGMRQSVRYVVEGAD
ncbi:hypothetical protein ACFOGJ_08850 [Marinibaculum pumilum]|uniref:Uncharacterized protein n=1 Tax=Marinibaculum pumilum TaxID=1766165 RepID=A0ABV7KY57_9PROT